MNKIRPQLSDTITSTGSTQKNQDNVGIIDMAESQNMAAMMESLDEPSKHFSKSTVAIQSAVTDLSLTDRKQLPVDSRHRVCSASRFFKDNRQIVMANVDQLQEELDREFRRLQRLIETANSLS